jgi:protein involved in polysaccharide export with SLBB domain
MLTSVLKNVITVIPGMGFALLAACSILLPLAIAVGQDRQKSGSSKSLEDLERSLDDRTAASVSSPSGIALESTVDPEQYYVGPSDVISVSIWMSPPLSLPLTVTPEGTLIIPTVGEVMVANLTLSKAKERILKEVRRKYLSVEVTATLVKPRPIIVSVVGTVLNEGLYTVNAVDRANKAISDANKPAHGQSQDDVFPIIKAMSTRNILVKHRDGTQARVDLPKYFATKNEQWNPYLREGDIVLVPQRDPAKNTFAVYGQVNSPGRYELVEGDSVLGAIRIANGLTRQALAEKVIFSRMSDDGATLSNHNISIPGIMNGTEPDLSLQPGDRIIVNSTVDLRQDYNVDVRGEVVYPGTYPISKNRTRLSDIIRQSGGFTEYATLGSAVVVRQPYRQKENEIERLLSMRGEVANDDSAGFSFATDLRMKREEVNVDFDKLFREKDSTQDIILEPEDQITIPSRRQTVYVFGQVGSPGHIPFVAEREVSYYVNKAGGFIDRSNKGSVKIIKAKTKQWLPPGDTRIEEGDYIWVPAEPDRPFTYYTTVISQTASILSVIVGVAIIVLQVNK